MLASTATIRSSNSAHEVFAYLSDFSHAAHWHPDVLESRQLTAGSPTRVGARFHVVLGTTRWKTDRVYEVVDIIDGRALELEANTPAGTISESLHVTARRGGCVVRYRTRSAVRGLRLMAAPLLHMALRRRGLRTGQEMQRLLSL